MKYNKIIIGTAVMATLTACEKEDTFMRNYTYPIYPSDPTGLQGSGNIKVYEGETDDAIMGRVRRFSYLNDKKTIYLEPDVYDLNGGDGYTVKNPDPDYMLFPHVINSMSDEWGWDYYHEYVNLGEQAFCDKYFNGELTLGMKLD
tara:strand:+ start:129 stop:563 length:435 start_codon:yes stop_codon:yes gene_type:complete